MPKFHGAFAQAYLSLHELIRHMALDLILPPYAGLSHPGEATNPVIAMDTGFYCQLERLDQIFTNGQSYTYNINLSSPW